MNETTELNYAEFVLPPSVISKVDVSRLVTEVERVDNEFTTIAARDKAGASQQATPVLSAMMEDFLTQNNLVLNDDKIRPALIKQMRLMKDRVPIIHMTFAGPTDSESLQQLSRWLRTSVHQQAVISVGLQPALVGGVYLRTSNKVLDLSLRAKLEGQHGLLVKELEALRG